MLRLFVIDFCSVGKELNLFLPLLGLFLNSKAVFRSILQENPRGPASRGDSFFSFQTFFLSGEVIVSLHIACVAGVERGREGGEFGRVRRTRSRARPNSPFPFPFPFQRWPRRLACITGAL